MKTSTSLRGSLAAILAAAMGLSACGTTGGGGLYAGLAEDPMVYITVSTAGGFAQPVEYQIVGVAAQTCGVVIDSQLTSVWRSRASGALSYGPAGAVSGAGQYAYPGATAATAGAGALVGTIQGVGSGIAYGGIVHGQTRASQVTDCINNALDTWEQGRRIPEALRARYPNLSELVIGVRAHASFVETNNSLDNPGWSGQQVGEPVDRRQ